MEKDFKQLFGESMREARKKQDFTQKELAEIVGVSVGYWRDLEHGKYNVTWILWMKICAALGIDPDAMREIYAAPEVRETAKIMGKKL